MPRPKSYDRDEAIAQACAAFWEHGYGPLGVRALEQKTGLNKFAIRSEFGGKEGLFLSAMTYYHTAARQTVLAPLATGGIQEIIAFFEGLVTAGSVNSSAWGCLMVNTGVENAEIKSDALTRAADAYWAELRDGFEKALTHSTCSDPAQTAQALVTAVIGIHTMNRIAGAHDAGRPLVTVMVAQLNTWRSTDV